MRLLPRSPTKSRPWESIANACGWSRSSGPWPNVPHVLISFPSFENLSTRAVDPGADECPSATKMSPFGTTSTSLGCVKYSAPLPPPGLPNVMSSLPLGLNSKTWCPFVGRAALSAPRAPRAVHAQSTTQTLPPRSTKIPCGETNIPAPNDETSFPFASNLNTAGRSEPRQLFAPQRSATHTLRPSASMSTAPVDPPPPPRCAPVSILRDGFGGAFVGGLAAPLGVVLPC